MRTLVVDDEPVARAGLRAMLSAFSWVEVVGEAADGLSAVETIDRLRPELAFLDVQMPGLAGVEVLRRVEWQPFEIFTTAFSEHAVSAFELGAVDYLLKPFGPARLAAAMERVRAGIGEPADPGAVERLSGALAGGPISRLFVRVGEAWFRSRWTGCGGSRRTATTWSCIRRRRGTCCTFRSPDWRRGWIRGGSCGSTGRTS